MSFDKLLDQALEQRTEANERMMEGLYGCTALSDFQKEQLRKRVRDLHIVVRWLRGQMNEDQATISFSKTNSS